MTVKEFYDAIGGSYEEALSRLMNDAFITRFLRKFHDGYSLKELNEAYQNNDAKKVFEVSHALKGVIGNLALTKLFNYASNITEATRNVSSLSEANIENELKSFNENFDKTLELIEKIA